MQKNTFSLNVLEDVDEEILIRLEKMNIDKKQARKFITTNQHNTVTTTYYLLLKQKLMGGGAIVSAEMLSKMQGQQLSQAPAISAPPMNTPPGRQPLRLNSPDNFRQMGQGVHTHQTQQVPQPQPLPQTQPTPQPQQPVQNSQYNQTSHVVPAILIDSSVSSHSVPRAQNGPSPRSVTPNPTGTSPKGHHHQGSLIQPPVSQVPQSHPQYHSQPPTIPQEHPLKPIPTVYTDSIHPSGHQQSLSASNPPAWIPSQVQTTLTNSSILQVESSSTKLSKYKVETSTLTNIIPSPRSPKVAESRKKSQDAAEPVEQKTSSAAATPVTKVTALNMKYIKDKPDVADQDSLRFKNFKEHSLREIEVVNLATKTQESGSISENRASPVVARQDRGSSSTAKDSSSRKMLSKDIRSPNNKYSINNIYSNLKKFSAVARPTIGVPANSSRSKGDKSASRSRERVSLMKSFDIGLEKSSGTGRKISNPSFQSTSTEDIQTKSFVGKTIEVEIRKSRSPFALDLLTDSSPKDILKELLAYFKKQKISATQKVNNW